jgi:hypothetical protein
MPLGVLGLLRGVFLVVFVVPRFLSRRIRAGGVLAAPSSLFGNSCGDLCDIACLDSRPVCLSLSSLRGTALTGLTAPPAFATACFAARHPVRPEALPPMLRRGRQLTRYQRPP